MRTTKRGNEARELDLVPVMNLVTILIPFLLLSVHFVSLAAIDSAVPAIDDEQVVDDDASAGLTVVLTRAGYRVETRDDVLSGGLELPCSGTCDAPGAWDTGGLTDALERVKHAWPDDRQLTLVPSSDIPYEVLVATMDAARWTAAGEDLFPAVVFAGGV